MIFVDFCFYSDLLNVNFTLPPVATIVIFRMYVFIKGRVPKLNKYTVSV